MATKDENYASEGLGQTGAWLGGIGVALALPNGGLRGVLGGGFPPPPPPDGPGAPVSREMLALTAENATLKAQIYTDGQTRPLAITQAQQGEQSACLQKQIDLRQQLTDQRIDCVAQTAAMGITALQQAVGSITKLGIPEGSIIPTPVAATAGASATGG